MCLPIREIFARAFRSARSRRGSKKSKPAPATNDNEEFKAFAYLDNPTNYEEFRAIRYLPSPSSTYSHYVDRTETLRSPLWVLPTTDEPIDLAVFHGYASLIGKGGNPYASSRAYNSSRALRKSRRPGLSQQFPPEGTPLQ